MLFCNTIKGYVDSTYVCYAHCPYDITRMDKAQAPLPVDPIRLLYDVRQQRASNEHAAN